MREEKKSPSLDLPDSAASDRLAEILAARLAPGDMVYLCGDLGSGKTHIARRLIRTLAGAPLTVPSPSFTLVQPYQFTRADGRACQILHADLYRIAAPEEIEELGLLDADKDAPPIILVEWPENGAGVLPAPDIRLTLKAGDTLEARCAQCHFADTARAAQFAKAWAREQAARDFLAASDWGAAARCEIAGDASARRYERLSRGGQNAVLMDWEGGADGPPIRDGKPYSQLVHLAEDTAQFCRVNHWLRARGLVAPQIFAHDAEKGFILLEDFGDSALDRMAIAGDTDIDAFYFEAVETLLHLHAQAPPEGLPTYDSAALTIETELFLDWFAPARGVSISAAARAQWRALWHDLLTRLPAESVLVLRDFHSPNILWLPARQSRWRVGLIDVQDALCGPTAYDVVSLLDDARIDVPPMRRARLLAHYLAQRFGDDEAARAAFLTACAIVKAQRNLKIAGIFERLAARDGKPAYRQHLPRVLAYLAEAMADPALAPLGDWCAQHLQGVFDG